MIALKEAQETECWPKLIKASEIPEDFEFRYYLNDVVELQRILTSIINISKNNQIKKMMHQKQIVKNMIKSIAISQTVDYQLSTVN